jgi:hypothetical protein
MLTRNSRRGSERTTKLPGTSGKENTGRSTVVERQLLEGLVMPRLLANPIAGPIGRLEGTAQSVRVGRRDLDSDGQSRNQSIEQDQLQVNRLKGGGIRPGI